MAGITQLEPYGVSGRRYGVFLGRPLAAGPSPSLAAGLRISFDNLCVGASLAASSEVAAYPAVNVLTPARPFLPWKTTAAGVQWLTVDFGTPTTLDVIALIRANVASMTIQGHTADSWGAPAYSHSIVLTPNRISSRYHHAHQVVDGFTYRYLRLLIPSQTPVDGAAGYLLGGLWAGVWAAVPRGADWGYTVQRVEPHTDVSAVHGGWTERSRRAEPIAALTASRRVLLAHESPGYHDDLEAWFGLDRHMAEADAVLMWWRPADTAEVWVMRRLAEPEWTVDDPMLAEAPFTLEEVIAGDQS